MTPGRFSLVVFDCDGVLVDRELITNRIFASMLNELGITVTLEDMFEQFVGHQWPPASKKWLAYLATGVAAGVAAGMTVCGYCAMTPQHRLKEAGAHCTFDSMNKLCQLLTASP